MKHWANLKENLHQYCKISRTPHHVFVYLCSAKVLRLRVVQARPNGQLPHASSAVDGRSLDRRRSVLDHRDLHTNRFTLREINLIFNEPTETHKHKPDAAVIDGLGTPTGHQGWKLSCCTEEPLVDVNETVKIYEI